VYWHVEGVGLVGSGHVARFFKDYFAVLKSFGVDGVKVDAQSLLQLLSITSSQSQNASSLAMHFHLALRDAVVRAFGRDAATIHSMCHAPGILMAILAVTGRDNDDDDNGGNCVLARQQRKRKRKQTRPVIRGSDDFWPFDPASHGPHLYANAVNSLLISNIGIHDWYASS
jgi:raffinose synthase